MATIDADQTGVLPAPSSPRGAAGVGSFADPNVTSNLPPAVFNVARADLLPELGERYRPIRKLGQGGMGAFYLCDDAVTQKPVAVKVLPLEQFPDPTAVARFQKETRLLAEVQHPNVANLLDSGFHGTTRFLVMELVDGMDLKSIVQHQTFLSEQSALRIIFDVASALAIAHDLGIVHRDIKPANILLTSTVLDGQTPQEAVLHAVANDLPFTVKLTDFGLARQINQGASMEMTRTGMMLGTPYYISPEQCTDKGGITPATDIYSLGATLFELLTGRPPFRSNDPVRLITMHCFEPVPDPRKIRPEISDGAAMLVARMLQKSALDRFADAGHLLQELTRLLHGQVTSAVCHPSVPSAIGKIFEATWEWNLDSPPADLWPHVSNTERVNAAVGLPPVEYVTRRDERGVKHRIGSFRLGFTRLRWEEHPFEWIEGRRFSILREFENGPFQWFISTVEIISRPEGGSRLCHSVRIATRGLLGQLIAHIEVNFKCRKPLDRVYRRIDDVVSGKLKASTITDPFTPISSSTAQLRQRLESLRSRLLTRIPDSNCLERFFEMLIESPAQELARIRPRAMARHLGVDSDQFTMVCLEACHVGLLELHWDILCPTCRVAAAVKDSLTEIDRHANCEACDHDFDVDFTSSVEMIFRVHPDVRQADLRTYCVGGPEHAPHVIAQIKLAHGESFELDVNLDPGSYVLRGTQLPYTVGIAVDSAAGSNRTLLSLRPEQTTRRSVRLRDDRQLITLINEHAHEVLVRLERTTARPDVVTASDALQLPRFRELFPSEAVTRDRLSSMATCTLLAVRITNVLELFGDLGDAETAEHMRNTISMCRSLIESHGGTLIREQEDRLLASFTRIQSGFTAALEVTHATESRNSAGGMERSSQAMLQVAMHRGVAMSTSLNGRLDVFGRAVAVATSMLDVSGQHRLLVSEDLTNDPEFLQLSFEAARTRRPVTRSAGMMIFELIPSANATSAPKSEATAIPADVRQPCAEETCRSDAKLSSLTMAASTTFDAESTNVMMAVGISAEEKHS